MVEEPFDTDLLDDEDPFEIDEDNRPHLYKHLPTDGYRYIVVGIEDLLDMYLFGDPLFYPPPPEDEGEAHWLMYAEVPGIVLVAPLAAPRSPNPAKCRPIGLYEASPTMRIRYLSDLRRG